MLNNKALLEERFHKLLAANGAALTVEAAAVMGFVTWLMSNKGKKVRAELTYLMNLQRELKM